MTLAAALAYARREWHVFPAKFDGRRKLGCTSAEKSNGNRWGHTRDKHEIREYWRRWPRAAIGLPTGAVNGFFVLDIDTTAGGHRHDGAESLLRLEMQHTALPWTRTAVSPTGSRHLYFAQPEGVIVRTVAGRLGPGIDTKGDGGFVVAPPSIRPGRGAYRWEKPARIAAAPSWLLDLVAERKPRVMDIDPVLGALMLADAGRGVKNDRMTPADLEIEMRFALDVIPPDNYHDWLYIGAAIYDGLGDAAGFAVFYDWANGWPKCKLVECQDKWEECKKLHRIHVEKLFWRADEEDRSWRNSWRIYVSRRAVA